MRGRWLASALLVAACLQRVPRSSERAPAPSVEDAGNPAEAYERSASDAGTLARPAPPSGVGPEKRDGMGPDAGAVYSGPPPLPLPEAPSAGPYSKRLDFRQGDPLLSIRLMEGQKEVEFTPRGRVRLSVRAEIQKTIEAPPGEPLYVRVTQADPAELSARILLAEVPFASKEELRAVQELWTNRGVRHQTQILGSVYGIAGKVIDNRRYLIFVERRFTAESAKAEQARLLREFSTRTTLHFELVRAPRGVLEVLDRSRTSLALGEGTITADAVDGAGFVVRRVEHDVGYASHGFEDRSYRGSLQFTLDQSGQLAVVNLVSLEDLLKGLVPSEIFARAHPEALKAQAVTARAEVLAKVGTKHMADPYLLCAEQHCAVYKGHSGEAATTNAAVDATRGKALFAPDGRLVDSVYSAVCGGHTEDNDAVWDRPPDPSLRGRPDLLTSDGRTPTPADLRAFLSADLKAACKVSSFAQPAKFRWERRLTAEEVNQRTAHLGLGAVQSMAVTERGVSGRAILLTIAGAQRAAQIRGELNIRRLFGMLNSAMFLVGPEKGSKGEIVAWRFRGGGWGHGVGLCQNGAIGRAEAGHDFAAILRHYFNGAEVASIY